MDAVFPIAVFFVFAASALVVLLLSANIYEKVTEASDDHFTSRTACAYILEKVRQNDAGGNIQVENIEGADCLALTRATDTTPVTTYIYTKDGKLKELHIRQGTDFTLADGTDIAPVESLEIIPLGDQLYRLQVTCFQDETYTLYVGEESVP
jgi:hypothetical protein